MLVEIIHKNNNALLTLNNESIPIDDILDIKLAKWKIWLKMTWKR